MRVSSQSNASSIAGALAGTLRSDSDADLECIGVMANYVAIKSILLAQRFVGAEGISTTFKVRTEEREVGDSTRTAIVYTIHPERGESNGKDN